MTGTDSTDGDLLYEVREGVGYVTFNRPEARNALTFALYDRLAEIAGTAGDDPALRAILITGAGDRAFAAGTDVAQRGVPRGLKEARAATVRRPYASLCSEEPRGYLNSGGCTGIHPTVPIQYSCADPPWDREKLPGALRHGAVPPRYTPALHALTPGRHPRHRCAAALDRL
jgi:hypothetical protein